jgi:ribosomal protein S18 acetylase RimI-like enzyme
MKHPDAGVPAIAADAWLAGALGVPSFSVRPGSADARLLAPAMAHAAAEGDAFFYCRLPVADVAGVERCIAAGFRLVETQVTLEQRAASRPAAGDLGTARADERDALLDIAGSAFRYSRFHQDPRIDAPAAHRVKRLWLQSCLDGGRGEEVLVVRDGARPAGFLAVLTTPSAEGAPVAVIDLVAVAADRQGRGHGAALVRGFVARWGDRASLLRVGTQAANVASIRLYERCGFTSSAATYALHAHFRRGRPA